MIQILSTQRRLIRSGRVFWVCSVAVLIGIAGSANVAFAGDATFYARGTAYELEQSDTELGVRLVSPMSADQVAREAGDRGLGTLQRLNGDAFDSRYRILQVPAADAHTREAAAELPNVVWVRPVYRIPGVEQPLLSTGKLIVRVVPNLGPIQVSQLWADHGVLAGTPIDGLANTYAVSAGDDVAAAEALHADARTVYAQPDFAAYAEPRQTTPIDVFFNQQWHLNNTGQGGGTAGADIGALEAWTVTLGEDINVGMLDDSCDIDHEDLRDNYLGVGQDIVDGDSDPRPTSIGDRHGTSVMGLTVASANDLGVRGVAPAARFTATRGLGFTTFSETASAYTFARQQEVDVHINSWGYAPGFPTPDVVADAIRASFETGRDNKGMVIVFATGNDGADATDDISSLPTVLAVGATNAQDRRSVFSNWHNNLAVMAPSNDFLPLPGMVTTDNTDSAGYLEPGYNNAGFNDFGEPNLSDEDYTNDFGGTSAACPVAAGVAALVLSVNPDLTATQVRVLMEHTSDQVSIDDADYDGVTSRSEQYGYGRVNAAAAVAAAQESLINGGMTWPNRVANVSVTGTTLRWNVGAEAETVCIVRSGDPFQFIPTDGEELTIGQEVTSGATVVHKSAASVTQYAFDPVAQGDVDFLAIYTQNSVGRFSWGVLVDTAGNVTGAGSLEEVTEDVEGDEVGVLPINEEPKVSIVVAPRSGDSPLTVSFQGNALTDSPIATTEWDFGDGSPIDTERNTSHTYTVLDGTTQSFIATFTVVDDEGDVGSRSISIQVISTAGTDGGGTSGGTVTVNTSVNGLSTDTGFAPLRVRFEIDTDNLPGTFESIEWDLGDGSFADTTTVEYTYATPGRYPVRATVTTCSETLGCQTASNPGGITFVTVSPLTFVEVLGTSSNGNESIDDEVVSAGDNDFSGLSTGNDATGGICGLGILPLWLGSLAMLTFRLGARSYCRT